MEELQSLFDTGDSEGLLEKGTEHFRMGEYEIAFEAYRLACKLGNVVAMGNLGYCYQNGKGVKPDNRLAAYCYERAAELDDPGSILKMGDFRYHGKGGLPKDRATALAYYKRAYEIVCASSEQDVMLLARLCYRIGRCKKEGIGTEQSYEEAYEYFQTAAEAVSEGAEYGDMEATSLMNKLQQELAECETRF